MNDYASSRSEDIAKHLLLVLKMINHLRLLDDIQFYFNQFIKITIHMLYRHRPENYDPLLSLGISKIWSGILNSPRNTFQMFRSDKCECLGAVFAIDLSQKLRTAVNTFHKFEVTKTIKQKLIIINLTLVLVDEINQSPNVCFRQEFQELHRSFKEYLELHALEDQTVENQFILLQYYIMSHFSLNIQISSREENVVYRYLDRFASYPLLNCQLLHVSFSNVNSLELNFSDYSEKIKGLIHGLIWALTDETFISSLQNEQKLFFYEDVKSGYFSKINNKCIKQVFASGLSKFNKEPYRKKIRSYPNSEFHIYKHVFAKIVLSFHHTNYLDQEAADFYLRLIEDTSTISPEISLDSDMSDNSLNYGAASNAIYLNNLSFPMLLKLYVLIFENKFIFEDINWKFPNLNLM
ncbi:hypothetical protein RF11_08197 [Thelohanellus kitauei]|uniref:Uncharacterized protein n=1 Tax=Thelohanellus kitauei TaxID=669202 RepID=A0A0C2N2I5_THEKT|nr:hypothetical protein RF11_08197 [Thelohanellus kitauei]